MSERNVDPESYALARWLRQQRRLQDKTQQQIADLLRVNRVTVAKWETGLREMRVSELRRYGAALGLIITIGQVQETA